MSAKKIPTCANSTLGRTKKLPGHPTTQPGHPTSNNNREDTKRSDFYTAFLSKILLTIFIPEEFSGYVISVRKVTI